MADLYDDLAAAGCETDNHESDLYVKATDAARSIVSRHAAAAGRSLSVTQFRHSVTGDWWLEVPFAFSPWWRARQQRSA